MAYADFTFYTEVYKGKVITNEDDFDFVSESASDWVDYFTDYKAETVMEEDDDVKSVKAIKKAVCALCDTISQDIDINTGLAKQRVSSETVGPWSVSYDTSEVAKVGANNVQTQELRYLAVVERYLLRTDLLYLGVR